MRHAPASVWAASRLRCMSQHVSTLKELLLSSEARPRLIADAVNLVESEVRSKGGVSGFAIKAGYSAVNKFKPTLVRDAVDTLIDRFVDQLEPFYADWSTKASGQTFEKFLTAQANSVANALLGVTDARAQQIQAGVVKKTYERLRPMGEKNVEAAIPGLARTIDRYLSK